LAFLPLRVDARLNQFLYFTPHGSEQVLADSLKPYLPYGMGLLQIVQRGLASRAAMRRCSLAQ